MRKKIRAGGENEIRQAKEKRKEDDRKGGMRREWSEIRGEWKARRREERYEKREVEDSAGTSV